MVQFDDSDVTKKLTRLRGDAAERAAAAQASQLGYPYVALQGYTINPEALAAVPESFARKAQLTGFELKQKTLSVAVLNPNNPTTITALSTLHRNGYNTEVYMTSTSSLEHAWVRYADITSTTATKKGVLEISGDDIATLQHNISHLFDVTLKLNTTNTTNTNRRISETLEIIFAGALALGASDIHIEPEELAIRVRYRLDGVLQDVSDIDRTLYSRLIMRLKLLSGMTLNERTEAQDGRFTFAAAEKEIEIRASVIPGSSGESIVLRLLDPSVASFTMDKLELNPYVKHAIADALQKPNGLIITTGPTGSGKTTSLYAFLQQVHDNETKIITIENPVEYKLDGIVQTQTDADYTFESGLRAILRQDPDVILVGEIRDTDVAKTAIQAAQTGHLVFSTLHTNSAAAGFIRLIDLDIDPRTFGSALNVLLGQRLLRRLCPDCKTPHTPTVTEQAHIDHIMSSYPHVADVPPSPTVFTSVGCSACDNTGYRGRVGIYEALVMDDAVEEVVLRDPREHTILEAAAPQKIPTIAQDGMMNVLQGITSYDELARVVELPQLDNIPPAMPDDDFSSHIV